ncbi:hypothetical protein NEFER03_1054 [Nematocida sp. LUAm3]|nr:hypothetical protein NEFER03_1054 [Nematocida sp. LUAm3]KAI5175341.1 hypothetical protein NEFER02_1270 [Nematocida sp. LUAm2]KAI5177702.1 hypothetical protein NEFER01_0926 [Nematocida sp. LUAm1]
MITEARNKRFFSIKKCKVTARRFFTKGKRTCISYKKKVARISRFLLKKLRKSFLWMKKSIWIKKETRVSLSEEEPQYSAPSFLPNKEKLPSFEQLMRVCSSEVDEIAMLVDDCDYQKFGKKKKISTIVTTKDRLIGLLCDNLPRLEHEKVLKVAHEEIEFARKKDRRYLYCQMAERRRLQDVAKHEWNYYRSRYLETVQMKEKGKIPSEKDFMQWKIATITSILCRFERVYDVFISELQEDVDYLANLLRVRYISKTCSPKPKHLKTARSSSIAINFYDSSANDITAKNEAVAKNTSQIMQNVIPTNLAALCIEMIPSLKILYTKLMVYEAQEFDLPDTIPEDKEKASQISLILQKKASEYSALIVEEAKNLISARMTSLFILPSEAFILQMLEVIARQPETLTSNLPVLSNSLFSTFLLKCVQNIKKNHEEYDKNDHMHTSSSQKIILGVSACASSLDSDSHISANE